MNRRTEIDHKLALTKIVLKTCYVLSVILAANAKLRKLSQILLFTKYLSWFVLALINNTYYESFLKAHKGIPKIANAIFFGYKGRAASPDVMSSTCIGHNCL